MSKKTIAILFAALLAGLVGAATADDEAGFPKDATFTTLIVTPLAIEGLAGDGAGNLYTTGRETIAGQNCPVWRINVASPSLVTVGFIPNSSACNPSGIAFDELGDLYIADGGAAATVWKLTPSVSTPPLATAFATGVPGTNGLAFDRDGNLWTGDGTTGLGRVWKIAPAGGVCEPAFTGCVEAFRVQPMRNAAGVGRQNATTQPVAAPSPQALVANGLAFTHEGDLYVADTARGALWKVRIDRHGNVGSPMGCDTTFTANTLCLDAVFVAHPYLEGTDGIALDGAGNIWNAANERNAIVAVTRQGGAVEVFRNPVNAAGLRNSADTLAGNTQILEFPTSPFLLGNKLCTANSDGDRRDNSPRAAGELNVPGVVVWRGKISCMDPELTIPGLPLPVR